MANEFIIKNGFHSKGDSQVTGSLSITGIPNVSASIAAASGGGSAFPFTGDAQITGSLTVSGSFNAFRVVSTNLVLGTQAGENLNPSATGNVILGNQAGMEGSSTTQKNVFIGDSAGEDITGTSRYNVFLGLDSGKQGSDKTDNIGIGFSALKGRSTGDSSDGNVAIGYYAANMSLSTRYTVAIGYNAVAGNASSGFSGYGNIGIGRDAISNLGTSGGAYNTAIGYYAGYGIQSGDANIVIGSGSLGETAMSNQLRIGHADLHVISGSLTTGDVIFASTASADYFVGDGSQLTNLPASSTFPFTGDAQITGSLQIKGSGNTFATTPILIENSDGDDLIKVLDSGRFFIGKGAANADDSNVVYGNSANAGGTNNIAIGNSANAQGGAYNVAIGGTVASVDYGIGIGSAYIGGAESVGVGYSSRTSAGTVAIGHDSGPEAANDGEQSIYIGNEAKGTADNSIVLNANGGSTITSATETNSFKVFMSSASTPDFQVTNTHITASGNISGSSVSTASFGTYIGDGSGLTNLPASSVPTASFTSQWDVVNNGFSAYRFTGNGVGSTDDNPDIYLTRGEKYLFDLNASGHPFQIRVSNGGSAYNDGVTNNGAQTGNVIFEVQMDAPTSLVYQCTSHGAMFGNIYIADARVASGSFSGSFQGDGSGLTGVDSIYTADGTIGSGRGVTLTDTLAFSGGTGIGIGTTPSYYFEVRKAAASTALARIRQTNATGDGLIVRADSTTSTIKVLSVQNDGANQIFNVFADGTSKISGSAQITGSLIASGSVVDFTDATAISGSTFSGSFVGNGSQLTNLPATDPFPFTGNAQLTGSLLISGSIPTITFDGGINIQQPDGAANGIRIGYNNQIYESGNPQYNIAIGHTAKDGPNTSTDYDQSIAIGRLATGGDNSIAIGGQANAAGYDTSVIIGDQSSATGNNSTVIGALSTAKGGVSIGRNTNSNKAGSITIGVNTTNNQDDSIVLNATAGVVTHGVDDSFAVYMTDETTPDFQIEHDGTSFMTGTGKFEFRNTGGIVSTGSLTVSGSVVDFTDATAISGSTFSGSFVGDGSQLTIPDQTKIFTWFNTLI